MPSWTRLLAATPRAPRRSTRRGPPWCLGTHRPGITFAPGNEEQMITSGALNREGFELALDRARETATSTDLRGLSAPGDGVLLGQIASVWESGEIALRKAYLFGKEQARGAMDTAVAKAEELIQSAGNRAKEVHQALLMKIQDYLN